MDRYILQEILNLSEEMSGDDDPNLFQWIEDNRTIKKYSCIGECDQNNEKDQTFVKHLNLPE